MFNVISDLCLSSNAPAPRGRQKMWGRFLDSQQAAARSRNNRLLLPSADGAKGKDEDLKSLDALGPIKNLDEKGAGVDAAKLAANPGQDGKRDSLSSAGRYIEARTFQSRPSQEGAAPLTLEGREEMWRKECLQIRKQLLVVSAEAEATQKVLTILVDQGDQLRLERESMHIVSRSTLNAASEIVDEYKLKSISLAAERVTWKAIAAASSALVSQKAKDASKAQDQVAAEKIAATAAEAALELERRAAGEALELETEKAATASASARQAQRQITIVFAEMQNIMKEKEQLQGQIVQLQSEAVVASESLEQAGKLVKDADNRAQKAQGELDLLLLQAAEADQLLQAAEADQLLKEAEDDPGAGALKRRSRSVVFSDVVGTSAAAVVEDEFGGTVIDDEESGSHHGGNDNASSVDYSEAFSETFGNCEAFSEASDTVDDTETVSQRLRDDFSFTQVEESAVAIADEYEEDQAETKTDEGDDGYYRQLSLARNTSQYSTFEDDDVMQVWVSPTAKSDTDDSFADEYE